MTAETSLTWRVHTDGFILQWSRGLLTAETLPLPMDQDDLRDPSMEPRSFDRGDAGAAHSGGRAGRPSMEPRSFDRGDATTRVSGYPENFCLQWSRGLLTAETRGEFQTAGSTNPFNGAAVF